MLAINSPIKAHPFLALKMLPSWVIKSVQENKQTQIILRTLHCVGEENDKTMSVLYQENEPD